MIPLTDGPIVYVDDDDDNQFLFKRAVRELDLTNELHFFYDGQQLLDYLATTQERPLLILCELNMPVMDGIALRHRIDEDEHLKRKAIPFIFYTTDASPAQISEAYKGVIQGFHIKPVEFFAFKEQVTLIVSYWQSCLHSNSF